MSDIREGRVSRSSVESVWSHSTEKIGRGTHFGFRKFLVSENTIGKKRGGGEEGSITIFPQKFFVSQGRKISQGKHLVLH